jgi:hypothetical protein
MINSFLIPLLFTILIEGTSAILIGFRDKLFLLTLVVVNFITNPFLNYIIAIINLFGKPQCYYCIIIILEVLIAIFEGAVYSFALKKQTVKMIVLSFVLNFISFLSGFILLS